MWTHAAASVVGLETKTFLGKIHQDLGEFKKLRVARLKKRDHATRYVDIEQFSEVVFALDFPGE